MTFYDDTAQTAQDMITEFGRTITLRRNNEGVYNPLTDTVTGATQIDVPVKAVFTDFKENEIDGTLIVRGDKRVLLAAAALVAGPEHNDILVDGAEQYHVVELMAVQPGDTAIIYKLQVRR